VQPFSEEKGREKKDEKYQQSNQVYLYISAPRLYVKLKHLIECTQHAAVASLHNRFETSDET
jgi:hypothetical protein